MSGGPSSTRLWGVLAEFAGPDELLHAAEQLRDAGYTRTDAFTPYPLEELDEALGVPPSRLPAIVLAGGVLGGVGGFAFQAWASVVAYPMNVGGRAHFSWPAFVVPAFETTILGAALAAVLGMLALNGLPMPYHPVFNVERFALASRDSWFLCVEAADARFDPVRTREQLERWGATEVHDVRP